MFLAIIIFAVGIKGQHENETFKSVYGLSESGEDIAAPDEKSVEEPGEDLALPSVELTDLVEAIPEADSPQPNNGSDDVTDPSSGDPPTDVTNILDGSTRHRAADGLQDHEEPEVTRTAKPAKISGRMSEARSGKYVSYGE